MSYYADDLQPEEYDPDMWIHDDADLVVYSPLQAINLLMFA